MTGITNLPEKNEHGDNGWWKVTGAEYAHYYQKRIATCGITLIKAHGNRLHPKSAYDRRCKNCMKVRRNRLIARMNAASKGLESHDFYLLSDAPYSPRKPQ